MSVMRTKHTRGCRSLFLMSFIFFSLSTHASSDDKATAIYPDAILGIWELGPELCELPGNTDSDGRIAIERDKLIGYEEYNVPLRVFQISRSPKAWKIKSVLRIYEDRHIDYQIFALTGPDRLTVVSDTSSYELSRCK